MMTLDELTKIIEERYDGLNLVFAYSEQSYFYNPNNVLPRGIYFATIKEQDGANDKGSNLDREGFFRLSFGVTLKSYMKLFGEKPTRPEKGGVVNTGHIFTQLNKLMPHPVYAWIGWVQILNPEENNLLPILELLDEKFEVVKKQFLKKRP